MKSLLLGLVLLGSYSGLALAAEGDASTTGGTIPGSMEFTGNVVSDSCKLSGSGGSSNGIINVNMGSISADDIGTVTAPNFSVSQSSTGMMLNVDCKTEQAVSITFAALPSNLVTDSGNNILQLNSGSGASGVGIAVYPTGSKTAINLATGKLLDSITVGPDSPVKVQFDAAYVKSGSAAVTPGTANASLPFVISYQ